MNIDQHQGLQLLVTYWSKFKQHIKTKTVFVGDVHGDFNQFIAPLIMTGVIELDGTLIEAYHSEYPEASVWVPKFVVKDTSVTVYYLGDYIDEGLFSRNILMMMCQLPDNCKYVIGNHDANVLGRYLKWKDGSLQYNELRTYWSTFQKEMSYSKTIHVVGADVIGPSNFVHEYFRPLFESLYDLFKTRFKVIYEWNGWWISHTVITDRTLKDLIDGKTRMDGDDRPINEGHVSSTSMVDSINNRFYYASAAYIKASSLLYNRRPNPRHDSIVGHTPGGEYAYMNVNPIGCETDDDRLKHCQPVDRILWFDIKASSGYDIDGVSRPDFFYYDDSFKVTRLHALRLYYDVEIKKLCLDEYKGKHKTDGVVRAQSAN